MAAPTEPAHWNQLWARELILACLASGHQQFFVAPGSRSTPLTLGLGELPAGQVVTHYDERGLAYACLGFGRATERAGVFVCTSGTAAANALPAVVEAANEHIPMLLVTADRPPELRSVGANQAIHQVGLYGSYAVWSFDLPCPSPEIPLSFVRSTALHACRQSQRGPVHLNCMFREPFVSASSYPPGQRPECDPVGWEQQPAELTVDDAAFELTGGGTIVIAGSGPIEQSRAARALAQRLGAVFLADITSSLHDRVWCPALLMDSLPHPETVIHVGGRIVSRQWFQFLAQRPPKCYIHFHRWGSRIDPQHLAPHCHEMSTLATLQNISLQRQCPAEFRRQWDLALEQVRCKFDEAFSADDSLHEPGLTRVIAELLPSGHALFLGNSMPVRDFDQFAAWEFDRDILVGANRGASGIDGLMATAIGFAIGSRRPTTLVIGDLSYLHDLNSLTLLRQSPVPVVIVVLNNNGGGIFQFLPIADADVDLERLFVMPHDLPDFSFTAAQFGIPHHRVTRLDEFRQEYSRLLTQGGNYILEVPTDRRHNVRVHKQLREALR